MDFVNNQKVIGGVESQVIVGLAQYTIANKLRGFALTVRSQGTIISSINVQDENGAIRPYAPTWLGIPLNQGDYFLSLSPIVNITLTAATDSITIHCNNL